MQYSPALATQFKAHFAVLTRAIPETERGRSPNTCRLAQPRVRPKSSKICESVNPLHAEERVRLFAAVINFDAARDLVVPSSGSPYR
jgi:hypothetical protein